MVDLATFFRGAVVMQANPVPRSELQATTYFINAVLISAIMFLVLAAILYTEITRGKSARGTVKLEEDGGRIIELRPDRIVIETQWAVRNHSSIPTHLKRIDYSVYADGNLLGSSSRTDEMSISPGPTVAIVRTLDLSLESMKPDVNQIEAGKASCRVVGALHVDTAYGAAVVPFSFEAANKGGWS